MLYEVITNHFHQGQRNGTGTIKPANGGKGHTNGRHHEWGQKLDRRDNKDGVAGGNLGLGLVIAAVHLQSIHL